MDSQEETALHHTARLGNVQAYRLLVQHGADHSIVSKQGCRAADLAPEALQKILKGELDVDYLFRIQ